MIFVQVYNLLVNLNITDVIILLFYPNWIFLGRYVDEGATAPIWNLLSPECSRSLNDCMEGKVDLIIIDV